MSDLWYQAGLKFKCTECGRCCTGSPGYVFLSEEEMLEMAKALDLEPALFLKKYTRTVKGRIALLERRLPNGDYDCIFLKGRHCQVYSTRPKQCRTFPWWKENLTSPATWEEAATLCEGINHPDAPLIQLSTIEETLRS